MLRASFFLQNENHAIVARFKRGLTGEEKVSKGKGQDVFCEGLPLGGSWRR